MFGRQPNGSAPERRGVRVSPLASSKAPWVLRGLPLAACVLGKRVAQVSELGLSSQQGKALRLGQPPGRELVTNSGKFLEDGGAGD